MICPSCRARFRALLVTLGEAHGVDLLTMAQQLEPDLRLVTSSTFTQRAAELKRSPSGTMAALRVPDTDPAPAPIPREEPE